LDIGIDIDFVYVVVDVFDNFGYWYFVGFLDLVVVFANYFQLFLVDVGRVVHD
jgi:hypothetical protein